MKRQNLTSDNFKYYVQKNIIFIRRINNLTQQQMADKIGIKRSLLGAIEEGRALGINNIYKVFIAFNYTIDDLMTAVLTHKTPHKTDPIC
jgi:transcriptional regulator with XRE-family HTH domain